MRQSAPGAQNHTPKRQTAPTANRTPQRQTAPTQNRAGAGANRTPQRQTAGVGNRPPVNRQPAVAHAAGAQANAAGGSDSKKVLIICIAGGILLLSILIGGGIFLFRKFGDKLPFAKKSETQTEEMQEAGDGDAEDLETDSVTPTPTPTPTPAPTPEPEVAEEYTDSAVEEAVESEAYPGGGGNYYSNASDEEWLRANEEFASLVGMSWFNGEATSGFRFEEASPERGIYAIWFYYSPFNGTGEYEEVLKCEPLGGRITESGDGFETTVYCEGYNITFIYNFVYGSMDAYSEPVNPDQFPIDTNFLPRGDYYNY